MNKFDKLAKRQNQFLPGEVPRYVRCYDNGGETADRFTCVFSGRYRKKTGGEFWYLSMSSDPYHPQGIGQHGSSPDQIDRPKSSHLGRRIKFEKLPDPVRRCIVDTYSGIWGNS